MADFHADTRILIVDDDNVDVRVITRFLERCGSSTAIDYVTDLSRVDALARSGDYDCMLLEYRFAAGTAFELFGDLLAAPVSERAAIILLTATGGEDIAARSIQLGAEEYMSKANLSPNALCRAIGSALEKSALQRQSIAREKELVRMSLYDSLTGLPNRQLFIDRLDQTIRESGRASKAFGILMMDLDLFKDVNDTYGHEAGDRLLQQLASRLQKTMRASDTLARLGGDEFAAILPTTNNLEGGIVVAEKVCTAVSSPFPIDDKFVRVDVSVGVALYPDNGDNRQALLRHADSAMYDAKAAGSGFSVSGKHSGGQSHDPAFVAQSLKAALDNDELYLVYQPQVDLSTGAVTGVEALVRWNHPTLGKLPPSRFIPVAERMQIIERLTLNLVGKALAQCRPWLSDGRLANVSVNLSANLLDRDGFAERIRDVVSRSGVLASKLCFEVTETGIMRSPDKAERTLCDLSGLGARISIDDFGTGYGSLKYLRDFPIDEIKIDRLFVSGLGNEDRDDMIVKSIIGLGDSLGMNVVAEGIENGRTQQALRDLNCQAGQGFHIATPMTPDDFVDWYNGWEAANRMQAGLTAAQ